MIRIPDLADFTGTPSAGSKTVVWDAATDRTYKIDPASSINPLTLTGYYNVKDYGAVGDGVTDDTAAIQAAQDAMTTAYGGILFFPFGRYKISAPINITRASVTIQGSGRGQNNAIGSQIVGGVNHDLIRNTGLWFLTIRDIGLYRPASGNTLECKHVSLSGVSYALIDNCHFQNLWNGVYLTSTSQVTISNCTFYNFLGTSGDTYGICSSDATAPSIVTRVIACNFYGINTLSGTHGILAPGGDTGYVTSCAFTKLAAGVKLTAGTGGGPTPQFWHLVQSEFENCDIGVWLDTTTRFYATDVQVASSQDYGFRIGPAAGGQGSFVGCMAVNNDRHGFFFDSVTGGSYSLTGCIASGNSLESSNSYDGVNITNSDNITITGGRFGGGGTNAVPGTVTQRNGVRNSGAANVGISVVGANLQGNNTAFFSNGTELPVVEDCRGYFAQTGGGTTSAVPNASGIVTITHGLGRIPVAATVSLYGATGTVAARVASYSSTNLVVNVFDTATGANITSGTYNIQWQARTALG